MKINGKSKTPIIAAQSKKNSGDKSGPSTGKTGGKKARASSKSSKNKKNGVITAVLERISDGILALDAGLNYTYLNERAGELLGCEADDLIGRSLWEAHPEARGTPFADACRRALETQTIVPLDGYSPTSDRWLEGRIYPSADGLSILFSEGVKNEQEKNGWDISTLPEQNPNPVLRFTRDGQILYANKASGPLLKAWENREENSTPLAEIQALLPAVLKEGLNTEIEIANDGTAYMGLLVPIREGGYINLYLRDITERKLAEQKLRAAHKKAEATAYRMARLQDVTAALSQTLTPLEVAEVVVNQGAPALDAVSSTVFLVTKDGEYFELMYSSSQESLVRPYTRFPVSADVPAAEAVRTGKPIWIESREQYLERYPQLTDQIQRWGHQAAMAIPMAYKGRILGVITLSFDRVLESAIEDQQFALTLARQGAQALDRARAETALRESKQRMSLTYDHTAIGIVETTPDERFIGYNDEFCRILGYTKEELLGLTITDVTHAEDYENESRLYQQLMAAEIPYYRVEKRYIKKDGSLVWCEVVRSTVLDADGTALYGIGAVFDVSARKEVEEALHQSEERFARFMQHLPGLAWIKDMQGRYVYANATAEKAFNTTQDHLYGRTDEDIFPAEVAAQFKRNDELALMDEKGIQVVETLMQSDGIVHSSLITKFPIPGRDGKPFLIAGTAFDITERIQMEESLRESEERYRALVNQATAGIVRKDASGRLLFVNQAFCNMLGLTEPELTGRRIWELTHEEDVGENKRLYDRLMQEGIPFQLEKRLLRPDGSILWASVSVSPVTDATGRPHSAVSVYVDVTRRRQAENRLAVMAKVRELTREAEEPDELFFAISKVVGEHFDARRVLFNEIDMENDLEIVHRDYCRGVHSVAGEHRISDYSSLTSSEMMAGKTVVNHDSKVDPRTAPDYERSYVKHGERAYVAIPLMNEDLWVASLWMSDDKPRKWDEEDVHLLETIAERTWTAAEKLRVDRALRESEERLRVTFNTTAVGFATLTPTTHFVDVNEAFCRITGYSREELLAMDWEVLIHSDYVKSTKDHVTDLLAGRVPSFNIEKLYVRRDGGEIWVQNSVSLVRDEDDQPLQLIAISQDITERKQTEEALHRLNLELEERVKNRTAELLSAYEFLRESESTSRLILESIPDAIVITDREGKIVHANTQVESLFGYSPKQILGQTVETLMPERFREKHPKNRSDYNDQRTRRIMGLGLNLFGMRKDGSEFPVDVMLSPINNNTSWDVMVSIRDNTKQREVQEALRTNEEKLRTLFEILPVGISFLGGDGRVNEINPALTQILGLSKSQILMGAFHSRRYIHADGSPMDPEEFASQRAVREQKTVYNVETGIVKENGNIIWTSVNAAPVQVADVQAAVVTIDITERKQAEEVLRKHRESLRILTRRLVEVQEEERRAIARELHDRVGQNLAALTLNLNILRNQLSEEVMDKIGSRLSDSVNLVNDILTITRSVMADLRPNVLDDYGLDAALNEYADRFTQRYGIKVITRRQEKPMPRLEPSIEMTLLRIAQEALTNIARHAQASQAVMSLEMEGDAVLMSVEDNGIGILSWQKVNQPGSHGLRIMRERAEAFGGSLSIHSTYRNGTKIEVKLPLGITIHRKGSKERKS